MDVPLVMPQLGNEITEAEVTEWLKAEGDKVAKGELLLVITTPKLSMEIEAPASGTVTKITVPSGDLANVGATLAIISEA